MGTSLLLKYVAQIRHFSDQPTLATGPPGSLHIRVGKQNASALLFKTFSSFCLFCPLYILLHSYWGRNYKEGEEVVPQGEKEGDLIAASNSDLSTSGV